MTDSGGSKRNPPLKRIRGVREQLQQGQVLMRVSPGPGPVEAVPMGAAVTYMLQGPSAGGGAGKHQFESTLNMNKRILVGWFVRGPGVQSNAYYPGPIVPQAVKYPSARGLDYAYCETPPAVDITLWLVYDIAAYNLHTSFPFGIYAPVYFYAGQNVGLVDWNGWGSGGQAIIRPKRFNLVVDGASVDTGIEGINILTFGDL